MIWVRIGPDNQAPVAAAASIAVAIAVAAIASIAVAIAVVAIVTVAAIASITVASERLGVLEPQRC